MGVPSCEVGVAVTDEAVNVSKAWMRVSKDRARLRRMKVVDMQKEVSLDWRFHF